MLKWDPANFDASRHVDAETTRRVTSRERKPYRVQLPLPMIQPEAMSSIEPNLLSGSLPLPLAPFGLASVENQVKGLIAAAEANIERLTAQIDEPNCMRDAAEHSRGPSVDGGADSETTHGIAGGDFQARGALYKKDLFSALRKVLCLSQVSLQRRHIIHGTPRLWAQVPVDTRLDSRASADPYFDGLETFLARSAPFPISVSLVPNFTSSLSG
ncbi:hypothetical protein B0H19DRAFT_1386419 [Mycena capillaripes]|nr:hypothetical protein B0H19DRAFT_1386419 [Mycena capillaripes]